MNAQCPHKWRSTLSVLWTSTHKPAWVRHCHRLLVDVVDVVDWCESRLVKLICLSDHFDGKPFRECVDLPFTCHPSPRLPTFAYRSSGVNRLLLDLDRYGGTDPSVMFPLFLKGTANVLVRRLCVVFWQLVRLGSFPACWIQTNIAPIPKGPPSSSVSNYRPISITLVLSKVLKRLVSVRLGRFMELSGVLPTTQFAYRRGLATCDALCACRIHCKLHWRLGRKLGSYRLISAQTLIGSTIREFSISSALCAFCVVYIDTVSIKSITARYGGHLSE